MKRCAGGLEYELTLKKIKNVNMRVTADGAIQVSAPYGTDRGFIDRFVASRSDFILRARQKSADKTPVPAFAASKQHLMAKLGGIYKKAYTRFSDGGFAMPDLRIRKMTSQWGNCRKERGIITLNACLYPLPDECIEFVAAHELSHMLEPNHSSAFYAVLDKYMPDWREREEKLKKWYIPH